MNECIIIAPEVRKISLGILIGIIGLGIASLVPTAQAAPIVINFDDRPGQSAPFGEGVAVPLRFLVHDEYLSLGVRFDSAGGGICILAPINPVSRPNIAGAAGPGPVISYTHPMEASFWVNNLPGVVDFVSITLTNSSRTSSFRAFDINGTLLDSATGGASATLTVRSPGAIHSVRIEQGPMGFDNFTFDGLVEAIVPVGSDSHGWF